MIKTFSFSNKEEQASFLEKAQQFCEIQTIRPEQLTLFREGLTVFALINQQFYTDYPAFFESDGSWVGPEEESLYQVDILLDFLTAFFTGKPLSYAI